MHGIHSRRIHWLPGMLLIALLVLQPGAGNQAVLAAPDSQVVREDGILGLTPSSGVGRDKVCVGSTYTMGFAVDNISPGLEFPIPVVEAMVEVSDDQGNVRAQTTNGAGFAAIPWGIKSAGTINLTVKAQKTNYQSAKSLQLRLTAVECSYLLTISFLEEYSIIEDTMVTGATTTWEGLLQSSKGQGEDPVEELSLAEGSYGEYKFYVADYFKAPIHFYLDPPVSGDYSVKVRGTNDGNTVKLEIGTNPVSYPRLLTMTFVDYGPNNITVNYKPPIGTGDGNGMFLELNKLNDLSFPASGGSISLSSGMSCYINYPDRTKYSLVITLSPYKREY